ncbi:DMT family transporter [Bradyrhizobium sp. DOA1]|uniref:DMT family transporter n=1 Tax=Bradyrhizobium sp. DOA1 TaxID=1126616 RepID=UPI0024BFFCD6|nr:DMT family transporter [Bradyrhizobium sp. DOA1]
MTPSGVSARGVAWMLLLAVMWGLSIPVTKYGLQSVPPLTLTAMRFAIAVLLLFVCTIGKPTLALKALPRAAALGVLGIGVGQVAQVFGIEGTTASVGTIISATIPIFVVVFAALRLGQRVTGRQQLGLLTAFAGIGLVALGQDQVTGSVVSSGVVGAFWMLLSAVAIAFYYVWSVELTREYDTAAVAAWSTLFGFLALMPWCAWELSHSDVHLTGGVVAAAAYLGVAVSVAGLFLWLYILKTVSAPLAASVQYLQPVFGIAAAAVMFGDALGLLFGAGVVLILVGLALAVATRRKAEEAVPHE